MSDKIVSKFWSVFTNFHLVFAHIFIWTITILVVLGFYGFFLDRAKPIENLQVVQVQYDEPNRTFQIEWKADIMRGCDATVYRWLTYDNNLTILSNQAIPHLNFTDLAVFSVEYDSTWKTAVTIPEFLEPVIYDEKSLDYQIEMRYECNFMHRLKPIVVRSETVRLNIND